MTKVHESKQHFSMMLLISLNLLWKKDRFTYSLTDESNWTTLTTQLSKITIWSFLIKILRFKKLKMMRVSQKQLGISFQSKRLKIFQSQKILSKRLFKRSTSLQSYTRLVLLKKSILRRPMRSKLNENCCLLMNLIKQSSCAYGANKQLCLTIAIIL